MELCEIPSKRVLQLQIVVNQKNARNRPPFIYILHEEHHIGLTVAHAIFGEQRFAVFARPNFSLADKQQINCDFNSFTAGVEDASKKRSGVSLCL